MRSLRSARPAGRNSFQLGAVVDEVADLQQLARAQEAVALGDRVGWDPVDLERDHLAVEQAQDALDRTDPAQGSGAPAHRLGPGEGADDLVHRLGDQIGGGPALGRQDGEQDAVTLGQLIAGQAGLAQEAFQRLFRGRGARALDLFLAVGRGGGQAVDDQGQAARPGVGRQGVPGQAGGLQPVGDHALQVARGALLHAGGDFFGEDFEEELGHQAVFRSCST
jgi:hypothetical protein